MIDHVIVMAASPGRKMEGLTRSRPKAMLPILGKPMIAWVLDAYYRAGIRRFTVVVGEHEGAVAAWLSEKWHQDVQVIFAPQGPQRGTASTLFATRALIDGPFIIAPCDILIPDEHAASLARYFETHPGDSAVLNLFYAPDEIAEEASVLLDPQGRVIYISEMSAGAHQDNMTALPIYGLTPTVLDFLDRVPVEQQSGERALAAAIQMTIDGGHIVGALQAGWCIRLSEPEDLLTANILLMARYESPVLLSDVPESVKLIPPVHIDPGVVINSGAMLGPNVYLETGSVVGQKAKITETVVLGVRVGGGQTIDREVVSKDRL